MLNLTASDPRLHDVGHLTGLGLGGDAGRPLLEPGHVLGTPGILVAKVEDEAVDAQRELLRDALRRSTGDPTRPPTPPAGRAPRPTRRWRTRSCSTSSHPSTCAPAASSRPRRTPRPTSCCASTWTSGFETRQILSGVREHLAPEDMVGKTVVVVANLTPRTIRGLESVGMILFAEDRDGRLVPVETDGEPGALVKSDALLRAGKPVACRYGRRGRLVGAYCGTPLRRHGRFRRRAILRHARSTPMLRVLVLLIAAASAAGAQGPNTSGLPLEPEQAAFDATYYDLAVAIDPDTRPSTAC